MTFRDYLSIVRKRWIVLLLAILVGGAGGAAISYTATPLYQSSAKVYFSVQVGGTAADLSQSGNFVQSQMATYASFADLPIVLNPVIQELGLKRSAADLAGSVSAQSSSTTVFVDITVSDPDPKTAAKIANAVATELGTVVGDNSQRTLAGTATVLVKTVSPALAAGAPSSPRTERNIAAGILAGLLLGFLIAYAWERLDTRVRTTQEAVDLVKSPLLGQIWTDRSLSKGHQVMIEDPHGPVAEAVRSLRTNLQFLRIDGKPLAVILTSALAGEGKTTTAVSLAIALAETEARVLLIDADLRRPAVAPQLDLEGAAGLTTVLIGRAKLEDVLQPWGDTGLDILPSGQIPPNPSELLGSHSMLELLQNVTATYDFVLLDSAPLLPVTDTAVLAMSGVGVVIVSAAGDVNRQQLGEAVASVHRVGGRTLGVIVNKLPARAAKRAGYYYAPSSAPAVGKASPPLLKKGSVPPPARPALDPGIE